MLVNAIECRSAMQKTGIPGFDYCLNPYRGCSHSCVYCYADFTRRFSGHTGPWGTYVDAKANVAAALAKQLHGRKPPRGRLIIGTVTDPYQPLEKDLRLTRSCLELLVEQPGIEINLLTKSDLVTRDIDLLSRGRGCSIGFTITSMNDAAIRVLEPGAAPPGARLKAARELKKAGLDAWVFIAPLLPGIGDSDYALARLLRGISQAGIEEVLIDYLNPYPTAVSRMCEAYRKSFPDALPQLERYLADPGGYRAVFSARWKSLSSEFGIDLNPV
ncbi:MAG: radical SAM protein [Firmicutes bacterium]|nr:radical SAM protein [Bacillota bacterium]